MNITEQLPLINQAKRTTLHTIRNVIFVGIGFLIGLALFMRVRTAIGMRSGNQMTIDKKRNFNKRWNNRLTRTIGRAGQPHSLFALVHHIGRHSGKSYTTPVRALPVEGGFIIPLTYGSKTDWYRNLQAHDGGQLQWQGKMYNIGKAEVVDSEQVLTAFPLPSRFLLWLDGIPQFVYVGLLGPLTKFTTLSPRARATSSH